MIRLLKAHLLGERYCKGTEIMSSMIAKTISETGIRNMFLLVHKTLRRQWKGTIPVKLKVSGRM